MLMITKNSVVKFQNLIVNHKSRPVKSKLDSKIVYISIFSQMVIYSKIGGGLKSPIPTSPSPIPNPPKPPILHEKVMLT